MVLKNLFFNPVKNEEDKINESVDKLIEDLKKGDEESKKIAKEIIEKERIKLYTVLFYYIFLLWFSFLSMFGKRKIFFFFNFIYFFT